MTTWQVVRGEHRSAQEEREIVLRSERVEATVLVTPRGVEVDFALLPGTADVRRTPSGRLTGELRLWAASMRAHAAVLEEICNRGLVDAAALSRLDVVGEYARIEIFGAGAAELISVMFGQAFTGAGLTPTVLDDQSERITDGQIRELLRSRPELLDTAMVALARAHFAEIRRQAGESVVGPRQDDA